MAETVTFWKFSANKNEYFALTTVTKKALRPFKFDLSIFDGPVVYKTEISNELLRQLSSTEQDDFVQFCVASELALTGKKPENSEEFFVFDFNNSWFAWKKKMVSGGVVYKYGNVKMNKVENVEDCNREFSSLFTYCFEKIQTLTDRCDSLSRDNFSLNEDKTAALERLDEAVEAKNECESVLLEKFVHVINSKKQKIVELQNIIENSDSGTSSLNNDLPVAKQSVIRKKGDDESDEIDTDEEKEIFEQKRQLSSENNAKSLLKDEDLILHTASTAAKDVSDEKGGDGVYVPKRRSRASKAATKNKEKETAKDDRKSDTSAERSGRRHSARATQQKKADAWFFYRPKSDRPSNYFTERNLPEKPSLSEVVVEKFVPKLLPQSVQVDCKACYLFRNFESTVRWMEKLKSLKRLKRSPRNLSGKGKNKKVAANVVSVTKKNANVSPTTAVSPFLEERFETLNVHDVSNNVGDLTSVPCYVQIIQQKRGDRNASLLSSKTITSKTAKRKEKTKPESSVYDSGVASLDNNGIFTKNGEPQIIENVNALPGGYLLPLYVYASGMQPCREGNCDLVGLWNNATYSYRLNRTNFTESVAPGFSGDAKGKLIDRSHLANDNFPNPGNIAKQATPRRRVVVEEDEISSESSTIIEPTTSHDFVSAVNHVVPENNLRRKSPRKIIKTDSTKRPGRNSAETVFRTDLKVDPLMLRFLRDVQKLRNTVDERQYFEENPLKFLQENSEMDVDADAESITSVDIA